MFFICITLNHGNGPRGWHLVKHIDLSQAMRTPGLMVLISRDPKVSSAIVTQGLEEQQLQQVSYELAVNRANMIMRCYRPMIVQENLELLLGLGAPDAHNTPNTPTDVTKHLMGEDD